MRGVLEKHELEADARPSHGELSVRQSGLRELDRDILPCSPSPVSSQPHTKRKSVDGAGAHVRDAPLVSACPVESEGTGTKASSAPRRPSKTREEGGLLG